MTRPIRSTKQKQMMEDELSSLSSFFTAEEFFKSIKKKNKNIGIATVYRFLNNYVHKDLLHSYQCDRRTLYSKEHNNHCHFFCQKCGKRIHFDIRSLDFMKKNIHGEICHFQIDVHGICLRCLEH